MSESSLDPDEIEVEAEFFVVQEDGTPSIASLQQRLAETMAIRGYEILRDGKRVREFLHQHHYPSPTFWWRFKKKLGLVNEVDRRAEQNIETLRETRDDQPYRIKFRFVPTTLDDNGEGVLIEVECIPALRDKLAKLQDDFDDANPKSAVRAGKSELLDIAREVGFNLLSNPSTPAENYQETLNMHLRKQLQGYKYGFQVTHFADDADQALKYSLNRPALSGYFHGIEWAIIAYIEEEENRDIIEDEKYGRGKGFPKLVSDLKDTNEVSQTTSEALETMNTERIWMAHHKTGHVSDVEVRRVKKRFSILLEELFL